MAYRIGLVSYNSSELSATERLLTAFSQKYCLEFEILPFQSGEAFLDTLGYTVYNIVILDITPPALAGLHTAKELRKHDGSVVILFITAYKEYAYYAYNVAASGYLLKPLSFPRLERELNRILPLVNLTSQLYQTRNRLLTIQSYDFVYQIPMSEILYFEKYRNQITVHTETVNHVYYETIKSLKKRLDPLLFVQINQGLIVNWNQITDFRGNRIFIGEIELTISGVRVKDLKKRYLLELKTNIRKQN